MDEDELHDRMRRLVSGRDERPDGLQARVEGTTDVDAVLRLARTGHQGQGRFRAQGDRPRPQVVVIEYDGGILLVAENPSRALHKISEIYDRIAFAAVGKYNEFESLRVAGVRLADMRGFAYDRSDVSARSLANAYATTLGTIFTETQKPYEVEIVVAEVGTPGGRPALSIALRRVGRRREGVRGHGRVRRRTEHPDRSRVAWACRWPRRCGSVSADWNRPDRTVIV